MLDEDEGDYYIKGEEGETECPSPCSPRRDNNVAVGKDTSKGDATYEKVVENEEWRRLECSGGSGDQKGKH